GKARVLVVGDSSQRSLALSVPKAKLTVTPETKVWDTTFWSRNVAVVVVDLDKQGLALVHNLHTVFPSVRIVAVTKNPANLGPAAGGPGDVQPRRRLAPAQEDEAPELRQRRVRLVAVGLETVDVRLGDPQLAVSLRIGHREVGAEIEELVLETLQPLAGGDARPAEQRVQLVDGAVGLHERIELGDARAVAERRLARVAAACVDARQPYGL